MANEQSFKKQFQERLLNVLLDKFERSKALRTGEPTTRRPQTTLRTRPFNKDYLDEMDFHKREWMLEVLKELADEGIVEIKWHRFLEGKDADKVYLLWKGIEEAYQRVWRKPKLKKFEEMAEVLEPLTWHSWKWIREWAEESVFQLSSRLSGGLNVDRVESYKDLVMVLRALEAQSGTVQKRMFSRWLFQDTKHFEKEVQTRLVHLLRRHSGIVRNTDEEYLEAIGIQSQPKPVLVQGIARFVSHGEEWKLSTFVDGIGLYPETITALEWKTLPVDHIVFIENLSSFHQWVGLRSGHKELVIYTGGFPDQNLQVFLRSLFDFRCKQNHPPGVYHWGDIDLGGVRIFEFIRSRFFSELQPLLMDQATLQTYGIADKEFSDEYKDHLQTMLKSTASEKIKATIACILENQIWLEQEGIPGKIVKNITL